MFSASVSSCSHTVGDGSSLVALGVPLGYLVFAALLRDGAGGSDSGFGGLFLLPVLWLALTAGRRELAAGLVATCLAQLVPLLLIGEPRYPSSSWRAVVVFTSVAAITGLMVQRLVGEARLRAALVHRQAADVERASARLAAQNERLLELDRLKDEFIAVASHELRTPLTSISGYLDMALDADEGPISPTRQKYLATVQRNVARLTTLVNDLLFLARNDSQQFELDRRPVDLGQILDEAAEGARPAAEAGGIDLRVESDPLPPVLGDRAQLLQLVDNLVSNAIKFTPADGRIELTAQRQAEQVVVKVADSGAGVAPAEVPRLFERFFRASNAIENAVPGTGLGLSISQVIAEAHGGTIEVESGLGEGTTFSLTLPIVGATVAS